MIAWEERSTRRVTPRLFTGEAWEALSARQRDVIRRQRMAVVEALQLDHDRRYHAQRHLMALDVALQGKADHD